MKTTMSLRYSGAAVDAGAMDVNEVAANMVAYSNLVRVVTKVKYGVDVKVDSKVTGFSHGSFITEFTFEFGGIIANLLSVVNPKDIPTLIKDSFSLWVHLNGHPPTACVNNDGYVEIENNLGVVHTYNIEAQKVVMNEVASTAVERMVKDAMAREGMDAVSLYADREDAPFVSVDKDKSVLFAPVAMEHEISDFTNEMTVIIESLSFKDGNKWKVSDGRGAFYASISDDDFLARVEQGESFAKGDALRVILNTTQRDRVGKIVAEYCIEKVIEHKRRSEQRTLLLRDQD